MQRDIPLLDPPPGVKSNFKDPESWAYESIATTAVCFSLMLPFFVLRIYARAVITRSLGWDDCKSKMREGTPLFFVLFFCFWANLLKKRYLCAWSGRNPEIPWPKKKANRDSGRWAPSPMQVYLQIVLLQSCGMIYYYWKLIDCLFSGQLWDWPSRVGCSPQRFCRRLERMWPSVVTIDYIR